MKDYFIKFGYKKEKFDDGIYMHYFASVTDVLDVVELLKSEKYQGLKQLPWYQSTFYAGYIISEGINLKAGYSQMLATKTMVALKGRNADEVNNWVWLMLVIKFQFLKG